MTILVHTIDANKQSRYFSWGFSRLELAFDVLNAIVATGASLTNVELIEKDKRTPLPVQAFDGEDIAFSTEIQRLEREWQQLLRVTINE
ncbi:hypothetical protein GCM10028819_07790 [Spirosoma humi]